MGFQTRIDVTKFDVCSQVVETYWDSLLNFSLAIHSRNGIDFYKHQTHALEHSMYLCYSYKIC